MSSSSTMYLHCRSSKFNITRYGNLYIKPYLLETNDSVANYSSANNIPLDYIDKAAQ